MAAKNLRREREVSSSCPTVEDSQPAHVDERVLREGWWVMLGHVGEDLLRKVRRFSGGPSQARESQVKAHEILTKPRDLCQSNMRGE